MFDLEFYRISDSAIPAVLEKAKQYRSLLESENFDEWQTILLDAK